QRGADALDLGRTRLRGRRSGARVAARARARRVHMDRRRRRAGGVPAARTRGRHPAGARGASCPPARRPSGALRADGRDPARQSVGQGRQGRHQRAAGAGAGEGGALMSRLATAFERMRGRGEPGLVAYVTAGDPTLDRTSEILPSLADNGADVIEVGVPFSDPLADGPVIQRASERALASGTTLKRTLAMVRATRAKIAAAIVLVTYANPILRMGEEAFVTAASEAGVDGVLVLDLPVEEAGPFRARLVAAGLDPIFLLSPTTTDARIRASAELGRGFL